jgi:hypothetical protein
VPRRRRRLRDTVEVRRELARHLLTMAGAYYPGTVGPALVDVYRLDVILGARPRWIRRALEALELVAAEGADPAGWERDALRLLAGDPVEVSTLQLPPAVLEVLDVPPAPARRLRITAEGVEAA